MKKKGSIERIRPVVVDGCLKHNRLCFKAGSLSFWTAELRMNHPFLLL